MIRRINGRLVLLAVLALYALIKFIGQEKPKHTSIMVSRIGEIIVKSPL
jgi:hypothetical protein